MKDVDLRQGDCLERMSEMPDASVDSVVTDPPYGLGFMGKKWDVGVPAVEVFEQCLRVLKPGGHLVAFGGSRTYHRLAAAVEDAGFDIRDQIMWVYGSGFPKSQNVSKAIDKAAGAEREVVGPGRWNSVKGDNSKQQDCLIRPGGKHNVTAPHTEAARQWDGWGTALKPAHEPIVVARKPLTGTVANNVMEYGTGAINVDGCRVDATDKAKFPSGVISETENNYGGGEGMYKNRPRTADTKPEGRFPANLIHDGSDEVLALFPVTANISKGVRGRGSDIYAGGKGFANTLAEVGQEVGYGDKGSAARFFYTAKANKRDRTEGGEVENTHPTVKPTDLMRYLCRMVTPPGGIVLDPFMGSGSTGKAAAQEGFGFIGIELSDEYFQIAQDRIAGVLL